MKRVAMLWMSLGLASADTATACECKLDGDFLTIAPKAEMVALIQVKRYLNDQNRYGRPGAMEAEVVEVYRGKEKRKAIKIWGSTGKDCRPLVSQFTTGGYYVIALDRCSDDGYEKSTDFYTSICGTHWLDVELKSRIAIEATAGSRRKIDLNELKRAVR